MTIYTLHQKTTSSPLYTARQWNTLSIVKEMQHLDTHKILYDQQHGFRKRRSCDSQLLVTIQNISANLDEEEQICAVLLDLSKAFDKVPHQRLLLKLRHCGIGDSTLQWVPSFLSDRSQQVLAEGQASDSPRHLRCPTRF